MNFKKLSAAVLAAGMALTAAPVFATESVEGTDVVLKPENQQVYKVGDKTWSVVQEEAKGADKTALESVTTDTDAAKNREDIIKAAGYELKDDCTTVVLGAGNYELIEKENGNINHVDSTGYGKFTVKFQLTGASDFYGKTIYVMHYSEAKNAWEVKTADVDKETGEIKVELESLSPLAFVGYKWTDGKGETTYDAPKSDKTNWVPAGKDGSVPADGYKPGAPVTPGATAKPEGGTTSAGSTIANKVSPNTAA